MAVVCNFRKVISGEYAVCSLQACDDDEIKCAEQKCIFQILLKKFIEQTAAPLEESLADSRLR
jgi:hypothetical protein